jgi:peroxiredoxin Q/BCP
MVARRIPYTAVGVQECRPTPDSPARVFEHGRLVRVGEDDELASMIPSVGKPAPLFTVPTDTGDLLSLKDLRGRTVVLYFYPRDDTAGCTREACAFRDLFPRFRRGKAVVLGISPDSVKSHQKFRKKYGLPFTLLADLEHKVARKYGLWVEKTFYGRKYMGVARTTYIIGPDGKIRTIFPKVDPEGHAAEVVAALRSL